MPTSSDQNRDIILSELLTMKGEIAATKQVAQDTKDAVLRQNSRLSTVENYQNKQRGYIAGVAAVVSLLAAGLVECLRLVFGIHH